MHYYECECCHNLFEIEDTVAFFEPPEHFEHGMCPTCFDKDTN